MPNDPSLVTAAAPPPPIAATPSLWSTAAPIGMVNNDVDRMEVEDSVPLLSLEPHHVVLGRYNREKKLKPLTPAVRMYKRVRGRVERGTYYDESTLQHIKDQTSLLLQQELGYEEVPRVTFWVDVCKAKKDGKLARLREANPQLRRCLDFDGEEVVFVQDDPNDCYLKADLAGHKKNRKSKKLSGSNSSFTGCDCQQGAGGDASVCASSVTSATRTVSTLSSSNSKFLGQGAPFRLDTWSVGCLDDEVDIVCGQWILHGEDASGGTSGTSLVDGIKRKTALVETLKSYIGFYRTLLEANNPCRDSPVVPLQQMNRTLLVQVVNTLGNTMVEWYEQHPCTCLPGEVDAWNQELPVASSSFPFPSPRAPSTMVQSHYPEKAFSDSEGGGSSIAKDSFGTFEMSDEEAGLFVASRRWSNKCDVSVGSVVAMEGRAAGWDDSGGMDGCMALSDGSGHSSRRVRAGLEDHTPGEEQPSQRSLPGATGCHRHHPVHPWQTNGAGTEDPLDASRGTVECNAWRADSVDNEDPLDTLRAAVEYSRRQGRR